MNSRTLLALGTAFLILTCAPAVNAWAAETPAGQPASTATDERVNINTATETELTKLRGINRTVARRIVEYRQAHGEFKRPEDIRKVSGIGKTLWEQNRDRIVVK